MKSMHSALKLSHHKHTGKIIHHHHTSYGVLVSLMLVPVIVLAAIGTSALADQTITVTATVPQIPPPIAPTVGSPTDGSTVKSGTVTVSGTCPTDEPALYVTIIEGTNVLGTAACDNMTGTYSVPIHIASGSHTIFAQIVSFTGNVGSDSDPVTFTYPAPAEPVTTSPASSSSSGASGSIGPQSSLLALASPLTIVSDQGILMFGQNTDAVWDGTFSGGAAPYAVHINWGDGKSNDYKVTDHTRQEFTHRYAALGSYTVVIQVTDALGSTTSLQVIAASALPSVAPLMTDTTQPTAWYWNFMTSDIFKAYVAIFFTVLAAWAIKYRQERQDKKTAGGKNHRPRPPRPRAAH